MPRVSKSLTKNDYSLNGVVLRPAIPSVGDKIKITYDGLLSSSGAQNIYAHVGFGSNWSNVTDYEMKKASTAFEASIPVSKPGTMNLCFRDCANHWDNNSGKNYSFEIS